MTGFFTSPQSQAQPSTPVEKVPGMQGLGQSLMQRFMTMLQGGMPQKPYAGFSSVYGGGANGAPGGTFPGPYANTPNTSPDNSGIPPAAFSQLIQKAIADAIRGSGMGAGAGMGAGNNLGMREGGAVRT